MEKYEKFCIGNYHAILIHAILIHAMCQIGIWESQLCFHDILKKTHRRIRLSKPHFWYGSVGSGDTRTPDLLGFLSCLVIHTALHDMSDWSAVYIYKHYISSDMMVPWSQRDILSLVIMNSVSRVVNIWYWRLPVRYTVISTLLANGKYMIRMMSHVYLAPRANFY